MRKSDDPSLHAAHKGRGATLNMAGRFESRDSEWFDDGWGNPSQDREAIERAAKRPKTIIHIEQARSIISHNESPDLRFTQSINPYRGCEHGCIYCYARPTHSYLNLSPGMDFETQLFAKRNAAELLRKELGTRGYVVSAINLGANTDPYQPIEKTERITRSILEVLFECNHPLTIVTKTRSSVAILICLRRLLQRNWSTFSSRSHSSTTSSHASWSRAPPRLQIACVRCVISLTRAFQPPC